MFGLAVRFDSDLSDWDVSSVTNMQLMFSGAQAFQGRGVSSWDISSVAGPEIDPDPNDNPNLSTGLGLMFEFSGLTRANYDAMLLAWSQLPNLPRDLNLFVVPTKHTVGPAGEAKERLITEFGWTITDEGSVNVFAAGDGTEDDPFQIANWTHLNRMRNFPASHFTLQNDLNSSNSGYTDFVESAEGWLPIGTPDAPFTGSLDGAAFEIADLLINRPTEDLIGLFGEIDGATIQRLTLASGNVTGRSQTAILAGTIAGNSLIQEVSVSGQVSQLGPDDLVVPRGGAGCLGGLVTGASTIQAVQANCHVSVDETAGSAHVTGGLVGWLLGDASIQTAETQGVINALRNVGGLVGRMDDNALV